jgi:hypothetical protein
LNSSIGAATITALSAELGREIVERLRAIPAVVIPDASFLRNAEHHELFLSGLLLAADEAT